MSVAVSTDLNAPTSAGLTPPAASAAAATDAALALSALARAAAA
jgi:hypothetical protein